MGILQKLRELVVLDLFRAELDIECPHAPDPCEDCRAQARADRW